MLADQMSRWSAIDAGKVGQNVEAMFGLLPTNVNT